MEFSPYIDTLKRHYRLIIAVPVVCALGALLISILLPSTYEAEAQLAIAKSGNLLNFDPKYQTVSEVDGSVDPNARRRGLASLAKTESMAQSVITLLGNKLDSSARAPTTLLGAMDVSLDGDLIRMKARAADPAEAALLANTWAGVYQNRVNDIYGESAVTPAEVQAQADSARRDYDDAESTLVAFLANNSIEQLSRQINQKQSRLIDLFALDNKLQNLISDATALKSKLTSGATSSGDEQAQILLAVTALNTAASLPSSGETLPSGGIGDRSSVSQQLPSVSLQLPSVSLQLQASSSGSPVSVSEQIRSVDALIATLNDRRKAAQAEANGPLPQEITQLQSKFEQQTAKKTDLTRRRDLASTTLSTILSKVSEVSLAAQSKGSIVRPASTAVPPIFPIAPRKSLNTILAGAVGLFFGVAIAFGIDLWRNTVSSEQQVAARLHLRTAGAIPEASSKHDTAASAGTPDFSSSPTLLGGDAATADAFQLLRHNLQAGRTWKVLLVTSARPLEGKSTVAANLAVMAASTGQKVTLVDANLRHPAQRAIFDLKHAQGLREQLESAEPHAVVASQSTRFPNLSVIAAGQSTDHPLGLLASPNLERLIGQLKQTADIIIIDAPAALGIADTALAARVADSILLVVASDRARVPDVVAAKELLSPTGTPEIAVVLNRVTPLGSLGQIRARNGYLQTASNGRPH